MKRNKIQTSSYFHSWMCFCNRFYDAIFEIAENQMKDEIFRYLHSIDLFAYIDHFNRYNDNAQIIDNHFRYICTRNTHKTDISRIQPNTNNKRWENNSVFPIFCGCNGLCILPFWLSSVFFFIYIITTIFFFAITCSAVAVAYSCFLLFLSLTTFSLLCHFVLCSIATKSQSPQQYFQRHLAMNIFLLLCRCYSK